MPIVSRSAPSTACSARTVRQIVLDTETTGLEVDKGHRVIELGCVELSNRRLTGRRLHYYLNPGRDIEAGAIEVHGIDAEFLRDKPRFEQVAAEFLAFVQGAELVIHNAEFDIGFLDNELDLAGGFDPLASYIEGVLDTLGLARRLHPGQRNSLDALCKRYLIDNGHRELHGALLDAELLADVYLAMTGGQTDLQLEATGAPRAERVVLDTRRAPLVVIRASEAEVAAHEHWLDAIDASTDGGCVWLQLEREERSSDALA